MISQESHFVPLPSGDRLHLKRFFGGQGGLPVFLLHGSIENGRIFYSKTETRGLGPFLAHHGYDVFVADLRGRGLSAPAIGRHSRFGQTEAITEDLPALLRWIRDFKGEEAQHWIAHSWGGILLASVLARFPEFVSPLRSLVFLASKRCIHVRHWEKFLKIDLIWNYVAPWIAARKGYLPAKEIGIGSDNETRESLRHNILWVRPSPWIDPADGFNYGEAVKKLDFPPSLHLVGKRDRYLGHPEDVRAFLKETGAKRFQYEILSREKGNRRDYGHVDILTHPDAEEDHFLMILDWMKRHEA